MAWGSPLHRRALLFVLVAAVAAGLFSTLLPALHAARQGVAGVLNESSGGITRSSSRLRAGLSGFQAALSVVLLIGAGLFLRSLHRVHNVDLGFDARHVLYMQPRLAGASRPAPDFYPCILAATARTAGASSASWRTPAAAASRSRRA
ncbi:MAG: hypothetical protein ACREM1_15660 [Longimicrobiales bacterium]